MQETPAQRALTASTIALAVAIVGAVMFLPPMAQRTFDSVQRVAAAGGTLAVALLLHWAYLGICARHLGRSAGGWVAVALLFPIGSAAALILLGGLRDDTPAPAPAPHHA